MAHAGLDDFDRHRRNQNRHDGAAPMDDTHLAFSIDRRIPVSLLIDASRRVWFRRSAGVDFSSAMCLPSCFGPSFGELQFLIPVLLVGACPPRSASLNLPGVTFLNELPAAQLPSGHYLQKISLLV